MNWVSKVKTFWEKVKDVLSTDVKDLFKKAPSVVIDKPVDLPSSTLDRIMRAARALSPLDVERKKVPQPSRKTECTHSYAILRQVWVRIDVKKWQLHNELICAKCKEHKISPIG